MGLHQRERAIAVADFVRRGQTVQLLVRDAASAGDAEGVSKRDGGDEVTRVSSAAAAAGSVDARAAGGDVDWRAAAKSRAVWSPSVDGDDDDDDDAEVASSPASVASSSSSFYSSTAIDEEEAARAVASARAARPAPRSAPRGASRRTPHATRGWRP